MMSDLRDWTIASASDALEKGEVSSVELTGAFIEAMEAGRTLNAFIVQPLHQRGMLQPSNRDDGCASNLQLTDPAG